MMNTPNRFEKFERAQVLPMIVVIVFAVTAFAALMVDGGAIMLNRRTAQAAADAGALAGARALCHPTGASPADVATNYAQVNGATGVNVRLDSGVVSVIASVTNDSFFANIFNENSLTASAEAAAGCFPPGGNFLMPIAWSCRPSLGHTGPFDPGLGCKIMALDWADLLQPLVKGPKLSIQIPGNDGNFKMAGNNIVNVSTGKPPKQIYIVMDKIATNQETLCKEDMAPSDPSYNAAIVCDLDGDGKHDIEGGGNRGWLDLTGGGGGAAEMRNWIKFGLNSPIKPHTWLPGSTGTVTAVYQDLKTFREGQVVWIPVYNAICDDSYPLTKAACMNAAHASPLPPLPPSGDIDIGKEKPKFHVITFNAFYISCVQITSPEICPGFKLARAMNPDPKNPKKSLIPENIPAVEGFFLTNVAKPLDLSTHCDVNLGNCVVSLTK